MKSHTSATKRYARPCSGVNSAKLEFRVVSLEERAMGWEQIEGEPSQARAVSNRDLAELLRANVPAAGLIDRLKIRFRPYICPFNLLLPHIRDRSSCFDIGCGSGMFLRILAEYKNPSMLGGVEICERLLKNAIHVLQSCRAPVTLHIYNGFDLPDAIADYDYLFLVDVMHHMARDRQFSFLERLFARMRPGQQLLLKDIDADSPLVYWNKVHDLVLSRQLGNERSATVVRDCLERIGFRVKLCFAKRVLLYPHYAFHCTKL
jgi:2-polyprenyl-3-methyl-5-hydroxy-6-metoxy-1,4-benzoquinol methylase